MNADIQVMIQDTLSTFALLATELVLLFLTISYAVGVLQAYITPEKVQRILSSEGGSGYMVAAFLGAITPFCSCSTIPFLKGLIRAKASFGPMMVFLFASPLLNPIIIGLFIVTFGLQVALLYFLIAMSVSVVAGFVLEKLGFERYIKPEAYQPVAETNCSSGTVSKPALAQQMTQRSNDTDGDTSAANITCCATDGTATLAAVTKEPSRWMKIWQATWKDFTQVFPYLMLGVSIGALIYGFVPMDLIAEYAGENAWYAVPVAAIIGIPLYIRTEAIIPLSAALVQKGMALGSVMALIIGSAGASLTEVILLKAIFKNQMIAAFLTVVLSMAIGAGFLYNAL